MQKQTGSRSRGSKRRVLVTGASGNIGAYFAEHSHERYDMRLMVHKAAKDKSLSRWGEIVVADLSNLDRMKEICRGIDTVVHLAANPSANATWEELLDANIIGAYHIFVAARSAGCRRLIYASSIHAISGYPADVQAKSTDPVNPGDLYGVTKCFGEALSRYMAEQEGLSTIALRIGAFQPLETARSEDGVALLDAYVSRRDLNQLIERCIDAPDALRFAIFAGLSDNRFKRMDITDARELVSYAPQDDLTDLNPRLKPLKLSKSVSAHNVADEEQTSGLRDDL